MSSRIITYIVLFLVIQTGSLYTMQQDPSKKEIIDLSHLKKPLTLQQAARNCNIKAIAAIFRNRVNVDVNEPDEEGMTALHYAAARYTGNQHVYVSDEDVQLIRLLLALRADPNVRSPAGMTPLHYALERHREIAHARPSEHDVALIDALLNAGADPNAITDTEESPLYLAARIADGRPVFRIAYELLLYGAFPEAPSLNGLDFPNQRHREQAMRGRTQQINSLINAALDGSRLLLAALMGNLSELRALLAEYRSNLSQTHVQVMVNAALELAAGQAHTDVTLFLLNAGAMPTPALLTRLRVIINRPSTTEVQQYMEIERLVRNHEEHRAIIHAIRPPTPAHPASVIFSSL